MRKSGIYIYVYIYMHTTAYVHNYTHINLDIYIQAYKHMDLYKHLYVCGKIHMKIDTTLLVYMLPVYTNIYTDVR